MWQFSYTVLLIAYPFLIYFAWKKSSSKVWLKILGSILLLLGVVVISESFKGEFLKLGYLVLLIITLGGTTLSFFRFNKKWFCYCGLLIAALFCINLPIAIQHEKEFEQANRRFATMEDVTTNIRGTSWNYTPTINSNSSDSRWHLIKFYDGKVYHYQAYPRDGQWGEPKISDYTIIEDRYNNNGRKYTAVKWSELGIGEEEYTLIPHQYGTYGSSADLNIVFKNFHNGGQLLLDEGDSNPWRD